MVAKFRASNCEDKSILINIDKAINASIELRSKKELINKKVSILLITHSGEILNFLKPKITNVMVRGKIICKEKDFTKVLKTIKKYGYEKCKKCLSESKLLAN